MRIMVDTNILISAFLFPGGQFKRLFHKITVEHQLILSSYIVDELLYVVRRKFADKVQVVDELLSQLPYELVYTPEQPKPGLVAIRDAMDYPILYTALTESVDILVTGDKDFLALGLEKPKILTPAAFLDTY